MTKVVRRTATLVFMGSPDFALSTLKALAQQYEVVGVVTQPDRASGRGRELKSPPVKLLAQELNIPVIQPEKLRQPEAMEQLRAWNPELIVVAAFGQILRKDVLELPRYGCINVHASLLPRWRGAAPINAAILNGDEETGITIIKMDVGLDTGPILTQRSIALTRDDTAGSVFETLSHLGANLLIETLPDYLSGKIQPMPQPEEGVTYAPMLKKEEGHLDFNHSVDELERRVRAFNPWPGAPFECSDWEQIEKFAEVVNRAGYASPVRSPRGRDIMAACGQLKSASVKQRASAQAHRVIPAKAGIQ